MKDVMPWVIGLAVAYLGWECLKKQNAGGGVWNEGLVTGSGVDSGPVTQYTHTQGKESGPITYTYPGNMVL